MKKILFVSAAVLLSGAAMAQKLKSNDVPDAVRSSFSKKFPTAKDVQWSKENETEFEAEFKNASKEQSANFHVSGMWLVTETEIKTTQLPAAIQAAIKKEFAGFKIEEAEQVESSEKGSLYEVKLEKGEKTISVEFSPSGEILSRKEESEEDKD